MSQFIKFYFTSSMLNMFRTLIHTSSGACDFPILSPHWLCVLVSMRVGVLVWLFGVVSVWQAEEGVRRTPSQLHSLQQIPTQHDMLPQHLVYKNELNREYAITLARNDETP